MGLFDEAADRVYSVEVSRDQPSLQLVGIPIADARPATASGPRRARGRTPARYRALASHRFADDLVATDSRRRHEAGQPVASHRHVHRARSGIERAAAPPTSSRTVSAFAERRHVLDLRTAGSAQCVWATGSVAHYPWLHVPVLDERGEIRHDGRRHPGAGPLRHRPALPAPAQFQLHRRCRRRRAGPERPLDAVPTTRRIRHAVGSPGSGV